jgi:hypothetical protein
MAGFTAVHTEIMLRAVVLLGWGQGSSRARRGTGVAGGRRSRLGVGRRRRTLGGDFVLAALFSATAFARIARFSFRVLIRELVESNGLIDQSVERSSTSCHSTSLLNVRLETTEEHEAFGVVVDIQRRSVGLKLLRVQRSRTSLPKAEELIFRLSFKSAVTVDIGELLFEALIVVTKGMRGIDGNFIRPGERFILEAGNDKEDASFVGTIGVGADREDKRALNHEILEFRNLARERFRRRHLWVAKGVRTHGKDWRTVGLLCRRVLGIRRLSGGGRTSAILKRVETSVHAREKSEKVGRSGLVGFRVALGRVGSRLRSVSCFASAGFHSRHKGDGEAREGGVDCRVSAFELSKCKGTIAFGYERDLRRRKGQPGTGRRKD